MVALGKPKINESKDTLEEGGVIDREGFSWMERARLRSQFIAFGYLILISKAAVF